VSELAIFLERLLGAVASPKLAGIVMITTGASLVIPSLEDSVAGRLGDAGPGWILLILFLSTAALLVHCVVWLMGKWRRKNEEKRKARDVADRLRAVDEVEKKVLWEFYIRERRVIYVPADYPPVSGLLRDGILELVPPERHVVRDILANTVTMSEPVRKQLTPEALGLRQEGKWDPEYRDSLTPQRDLGCRGVLLQVAEGYRKRRGNTPGIQRPATG
jgi:hypothetical protein